MLRDEILDKLRADKEALDAFGVKAIGVFGSVARGQDGPDSDVDILVDYDHQVTRGIFGFLDLKEHIEDVLGRQVDLVMRNGLHRRLRDRILDEAVYA